MPDGARLSLVQPPRSATITGRNDGAAHKLKCGFRINAGDESIAAQARRLPI
jgi:hypothetical protein